MPALNIRDREVHELARRLASRTGETMTEAVRTALAERLQRTEAASPDDIEARRQKILESATRFRRNLVADLRTDDEIVGYNEHGTFD